MVPRRIIALFVGVALGLALVIGWRFLVVPDHSRGARMVALFEQYCVPFVIDRTVPAPIGLTSISAFPDEDVWMDEGTGLNLTVTDRHCTVSDMLLHLAEADLRIVDEGFAGLQQRHFADWVALDALGDHWERHVAWAPVQTDPDRSIQLFRPGAESGSSVTTLQSGVYPW